MSKPYDLLIFDWDGTLMDSIGRIVSCMQQAAGDCQLPVPAREAVTDIIGLSLRIGMHQLFDDLTEPMLEQLVDRYREHYLYVDTTPSPLFPGVAEQLACWQREGYQLAVATGKARAGLDRVLKESALADFFVATRAADEARSKPDPLMLEQLLKELAIPVERALMVGDSVHDMAMASALGMDRAGLCWGVHSADELAIHRPVFLAQNLDQLADWLTSH